LLFLLRGDRTNWREPGAADLRRQVPARESARQTANDSVERLHGVLRIRPAALKGKGGDMAAIDSTESRRPQLLAGRPAVADNALPGTKTF